MMLRRQWSLEVTTAMGFTVIMAGIMDRVRGTMHGWCIVRWLEAVVEWVIVTAAARP